MIKQIINQNCQENRVISYQLKSNTFKFNYLNQDNKISVEFSLDGQSFTEGTEFTNENIKPCGKAMLSRIDF